MHLLVHEEWITVTVVAPNWGSDDGWFWTNVHLGFALPPSRLSRIGQLLVTYLGSVKGDMDRLLQALTNGNPRDTRAVPHLLHLGGNDNTRVTKNCADNDESLFNVADGGIALCIDLRNQATAVAIVNTLATILDVPRVGDNPDDTFLDADATAAKTDDIKKIFRRGKVTTGNVLRTHGLGVIGVRKTLSDQDLADAKIITDGGYAV
jgi:hypothetical protein